MRLPVQNFARVISLLISYLCVDALLWDLARDLIRSDRMFNGTLSETEEGSNEGQGHRDAEPQGKQCYQCEEWNGRRGAFVPQHQVHDKE